MMWQMDGVDQWCNYRGGRGQLSPGAAGEWVQNSLTKIFVTKEHKRKYDKVGQSQRTAAVLVANLFTH